jgi:hypothetical protein
MEPETQAFVGMFIAFLIILSFLTITHSSESIVSVVKMEKAYLLQWNGENTTLTLVTPNGNRSIPISNGQQFACNGSTSIYVDNKLVFYLPRYFYVRGYCLS